MHNFIRPQKSSHMPRKSSMNDFLKIQMYCFESELSYYLILVISKKLHEFFRKSK